MADVLLESLVRMGCEMLDVVKCVSSIFRLLVSCTLRFAQRIIGLVLEQQPCVSDCLN